jgi:selenocysteine lyase/cysteine desulfurase
VFTRNTTDALNLLATVVPGRVLCLDVEHHANLLPWRATKCAGTLRTLPAAATVGDTLAALETELRTTPTALLTVTGASNVTGEVLPLGRIAAIAHAAGARVAVDAAQLAPHRRVDLAATGVDYVAFSGHKLYAPYGAGALIGRRDWLDAAAPYLAGGGAVTQVDLDGATWAPGPHRHEAGTPNVLGVAALAQACRTLAPVLDGPGPEHERALLDRLATGLATVPGVTPLQIWPDSPDRVAVQSFTVAGHAAGYSAGFIAAYLSAEHGIGVRDGRFCAHPLLDRLCRDSQGSGGDGTAVRASIGLGTTAEHVDRLLGALRELVTRGARWTYSPVGGRWTPAPDPRDLDPLGVGTPGTAGTGCGHPS